MNTLPIDATLPKLKTVFGSHANAVLIAPPWRFWMSPGLRDSVS